MDRGLYLIEGTAGAGKTTLGMQVAFHRARRGGQVLYMSLLTEAHGKLLSHIRKLGFFDDTLISRQIRLISGYRPLSEGGLDGLASFLAAALREQQPDLLLLDGFCNIRRLECSPLSLVRFMNQLNTLVTTDGCTALLLASISGDRPRPEHAVVDGLIELYRYSTGLRGVRELEVHKVRGAAHMEGRHLFRITDNGLHVFPRLEGVMHDTFLAPEVYDGQLEFGIERFDAMLQGGLKEGSTTMLLGAPGSGKTLFGVQFLQAGLRRGESAVYFGFYESPQRLIAKAAAVGIDVREAIDAGRLAIAWQPPLEFHMDELAERLLDALATVPGATRLVVDGLDGFVNDRTHPERSPDFLAALSTRLRMGRLTSLFTEEIPLFSESFGMSAFRFSATVENIILLRYVEIQSRLRRLVSIMKLRDSDYDNSIREFDISSSGITVTSTFESADSVLTGRARMRPDAEPPQE